MFVVEKDGPIARQQVAYALFAKRFEEGGDLASLTQEEKADKHKAFSAEYMGSLTSEEREKLAETIKSFGQEEWAQPEPCQIVDARSVNADLHTQGFVLLAHTSAVADFRNDEAVKSTYYPELIDLVADLTGATHVFLQNHIIREEQTDGGGPVQLVHNDFTSNYKRELLESFRGHNKTIVFNSWPDISAKSDLTIEELERSRIMMINAWRNVAPEPIGRFPLALCDMRTVHEDDLIHARLGENSLEIAVSVHSPKHRWNYFPNMTNEEVLLIKTCKSESDYSASQPVFASLNVDDVCR
jgi:hypothetical protein